MTTLGAYRHQLDDIYDNVNKYGNDAVTVYFYRDAMGKETTVHIDINWMIFIIMLTNNDAVTVYFYRDAMGKETTVHIDINWMIFMIMLMNNDAVTVYFYRDATGKETTVHIDINGEKFVGHGLTVIGRQLTIFINILPTLPWCYKNLTVPYEKCAY